MTREELIGNLIYTMKKYKNTMVPTFDTNIYLMCKDILDYLEKEPSLTGTTKNNLAVREFEEIEVTYPPEELCTYPKYKGKPYFGIKYKENGKEILGYGTYNPQVLSQYLKDYFISMVVNEPSVTLQTRWISVSERLPENDTEVIVSCTDDSLDSKFRYTTTGWHYNGIWIVNNERSYFVVAWMPLPEPYKAESE